METGFTLTDTVGTNVTVAFPVLEESAADVAVTVTDAGDGTLAGVV
jgi:hypothetical protein